MADAIPLWGPAQTFPPANSAAVPGIRYSLVHRQTPDFEFLHEPRLAHDGKTLYVNFSNAPKLESEPAQVMRGRRSADGGRTWTAVEVVAGGYADGRRRHETAPLLAREDGVWALVGRYDFGSKGALGMEIWREHPATKQFAPVSDGLVAPGFIPFVAPQRLASGSWIVGGHFDKVTRAAVAVSEGDDLLRWHVVLLQSDVHSGYPETALVVQGDAVLAVVRPPASADSVALAAVSRDGGRTFTELLPTALPMEESKPFAGRLSDGRSYLIWNHGRERRNELWIAVTAPGQLYPFERVWRLVGGHASALPDGLAAIGETGAAYHWAYPEAVERDGTLYVVFSLNKRHCYLAAFSVAALI
jgi:hypothetical protein